MRAVVCRELGPVANLAVEDRPVPDPGARQVRIAVRSAGAGFVDALLVSGGYQVPRTPPFVPGGEVAGVVDAVGADVTGWRPGDRVFAAAHGGFAEFALADDTKLVRLPRELDFARGASFLQAYGTAWFAFTRSTVVRPDEVVLVTGAGGGVGLAAVDVARSLGARVIAVASSAEKRDLALSMGAEAALDPLTEDVKAAARELTGGNGVDVVYDVVGGELSEAALRALNFHGRFLVVGFPAGIARIPLNLVLLRNRSVIGVERGSWVTRHPQANRSLVEEMVNAVVQGALHPVAPFERPLEDAGIVLADLLDRRAVGKTVLVP
ncbi:NADPH:quinone oxidoreductase family protein [Actinomadura rugatobispora]|uniref:NADPH:quinone oxidoreductase family protein n=1 Tax=Actinomadura rugatobispora TaxID=1994 RepID=A0ABW0ZTE7_9ACTN|nr:NADPH:quinone oxidoreductase family protein [Actinomadura rugatobispora]